MYAGHKVEAAPRAAMAQPPHHPYADLLAASVPELRRGWLDELGDARFSAPAGECRSRRSSNLCSFLDRCPQKLAGTCDRLPPPRRQLAQGVEILCHRSSAELIAAQQARPPRRAA